MCEYPDHKKVWLLSNMRLYEKVLKYLKDGQKILEIGCNKGYGLYFIAVNLPNSQVVGADINKEFIEFCRRTWNFKNLEFEIMDILNLKDIEEIKKKYGKFDAVLCFEVLEHIPPNKTADFLCNIRRLIEEDGLLFLSTPNKRVYDINAYTEDHINEMEYEVLTELLEKNDFKIISTFGIFSLNKFAIAPLLKLNLIHRKGDERINLSTFQRMVRMFILSIFAPDRIYSEILRRINQDKWRRYKYKSANLRSKDVQNSKLILFVVTPTTG